METHRLRWVSAAVFLLASIWGSQSALAAMKIVATTIILPENDKPVLLAGLAYEGYGWTVAMNSVCLERVPDQDADRARLLWTFVASSTRPMIQKIIVEIHLLDSKNKKIKSVKQFVVVKANTEHQELPIKMKVKNADWDRTEKVLIKATFTVL